MASKNSIKLPGRLVPLSKVLCMLRAMSSSFEDAECLHSFVPRAKTALTRCPSVESLGVNLGLNASSIFIIVDRTVVHMAYSAMTVV